MPLDFDYNAYWRLTQDEVDSLGWYGGFTQLQATDPDDGVDDIVLTAAPGYEPGPLGDYYLAASSPLYDADKRGSCSVADAGLYHYTTRVDQTKDGVQTGNVIIGRHYIATTGPTSTQPNDSDNDGIPDYVENWHGDGDGDVPCASTPTPKPTGGTITATPRIQTPSTPSTTMLTLTATAWSARSRRRCIRQARNPSSRTTP